MLSKEKGDINIIVKMEDLSIDISYMNVYFFIPPM